MSVGHPGESRQSIDDTRDWLLESAPDEFDLTIITTYPGTPYFDQAEPCSHQERLWVYIANIDAAHADGEKLTHCTKGEERGEGNLRDCETYDLDSMVAQH